MPTSVILQDIRHKKQDGTYTIKLRITDGNKQIYYPVLFDHQKISFTKEDWARIQRPNPRGDLGRWKERLQEYEIKARNIMGELEVFSFPAFEDKIYSNRSEGNDLFTGFNNYLTRLKEEQRMGTYNAYNDAKHSIERYKKQIKYTDIDKYWLRDYVHYMKNVRNNASTTQGIYLGALRVIVNAEGKKYMTINPFDGFTMPVGVKRTHYYLTENEVRAFAAYKSKSQIVEEAQAYWMFSFRCNGINFKDIAYLKWKDITDNEIVISRQKTKSRSSKQIFIPLSEKIKKHIEIYGKPKGVYVFDVLSAKDSASKADAKVGLFISQMNKYTSRIGQELGFKIKVTTTVARHSFATVLYRAGNNLIDIRDALGHSTVQTTESYIGSLGLGERDKLKRVDI